MDNDVIVMSLSVTLNEFFLSVIRASVTADTELRAKLEKWKVSADTGKSIR